MLGVSVCVARLGCFGVCVCVCVCVCECVCVCVCVCVCPSRQWCLSGAGTDTSQTAPRGSLSLGSPPQMTQALNEALSCPPPNSLHFSTSPARLYHYRR